VVRVNQGEQRETVRAVSVLAMLHNAGGEIVVALGAVATILQTDRAHNRGFLISD